jgi:hypothetical protein
MTGEDLLVIVMLLGCAAGLLWGLAEIAKRWGQERRRQPAQTGRQGHSVPPATTAPQPMQRPVVTLGPPRQVRLEPSQVRPPAAEGSSIRRGPPLVIPVRCDPLWKEKGWWRNGNGYEGYYRAAGRAWRGLIQEPYPGRYQAFIWDPPLAQISRRTRHGPCFQNGRSDGRYQVHYHTAPQSLDHAIGAIEDVLAEAFGVLRR